MRIERLQLQRLRCIQHAEITPGPLLNWLVGANGAGKTTWLEGIFLLSHGHSFRSGPVETLMQRGESSFSLFAQIACNTGRHALGMSRYSDGWRLRLNGADQQQLAPILERCAALCFEPGSNALINGASEVRRRFLDWGVFHVEHAYLDSWRRYRRALRQRNALLRSGGTAEHFASWETELDNASVVIEQNRQAHMTALQSHFLLTAEDLLLELGHASLIYQRGWSPGKALAETLLEQRDRDRELGYTRAGPHRADWRISFEKSPSREYLSRGQTKLVALTCVLAQARMLVDSMGEWPILCLDDPASELDTPHFTRVIDYVSSIPAQVWITSTRTPQQIGASREAETFHVEHSSLRRMESRT